MHVLAPSLRGVYRLSDIRLHAKVACILSMVQSEFSCALETVTLGRNVYQQASGMCTDPLYLPGILVSSVLTSNQQFIKDSQIIDCIDFTESILYGHIEKVNVINSNYTSMLMETKNTGNTRTSRVFNYTEVFFFNNKCFLLNSESYIFLDVLCQI